MTEFQNLCAQRNANWKTAVRIIRRRGVQNTAIWNRMRTWFDGVAGNQLMPEVETIVRRYMNELMTEVLNDCRDEANGKAPT